MKILSDEELKGIALKQFGSSDGIRPRFPNRGEQIQVAMVATTQFQLNSDRNEVISELQGILDDNVSDQDRLNQVANFVKRLKEKEN